MPPPSKPQKLQAPCLHDPRMPGEAHHPESAERVEWTETRNLATSEGERAGRGRSGTLAPAANINDLQGRRVTGRALNAEDQVMVSGIVGQP